jgi:uncharacterized protein (TIGR03086 family)
VLLLAFGSRRYRSATVSVELNHIIVPARDKRASAEFLAGILGVEVRPRVGPFVPIRLANGVTIDFEDAENFEERHCAFLVDEPAFDTIFARIQQSGAKYYADPSRQNPGEINRLFGGRGVYFDDPDGHLMEVLTWVMPEPGGEMPGLTGPDGTEIEPTDLLERAFHQVQTVVDGVQRDQMNAATPCTEWDVRALLNHMTGNVIMFADALTQPGPPAEGDIVGDDPSRVFRDAAERTLTAWRKPGATQRTLSLPFGDLPGAMGIRINLMDAYVHGLDLAVATAQEEKVDPELSETALVLVPQMGLDARMPGLYGPEVRCPESVPAHRRLLAFLGRQI